MRLTIILIRSLEGTSPESTRNLELRHLYFWTEAGKEIPNFDFAKSCKPLTTYRNGLVQPLVALLHTERAWGPQPLVALLQPEHVWGPQHLVALLHPERAWGPQPLVALVHHECVWGPQPLLAPAPHRARVGPQP